jgi:hypothetical protein
MLDLVLSHSDAGEMRDAADSIGVDGHEISGMRFGRLRQPIAERL